MLVLSPFATEVIPPIATATVLAVVIFADVVAVLMKTITLDAVVTASLAMIDKLSIIAPSFEEQSTSNVQPAELGVFKLVAVVKAAVPPIVANACNGLSTNNGILFELVVAISYLFYMDFI
jgi:hypothetical protein